MVVPSKKVTEPVGVPGLAGVTVAVNVTGAPAAMLAALELSAVVVPVGRDAE